MQTKGGPSQSPFLRKRGERGWSANSEPAQNPAGLSSYSLPADAGAVQRALPGLLVWLVLVSGHCAGPPSAEI